MGWATCGDEMRGGVEWERRGLREVLREVAGGEDGADGEREGKERK